MVQRVRNAPDHACCARAVDVRGPFNSAVPQWKIQIKTTKYMRTLFRLRSLHSRLVYCASVCANMDKHIHRKHTRRCDDHSHNKTTKRRKCSTAPIIQAAKLARTLRNTRNPHTKRSNERRQNARRLSSQDFGQIERGCGSVMARLLHTHYCPRLRLRQCCDKVNSLFRRLPRETTKSSSTAFAL